MSSAAVNEVVSVWDTISETFLASIRSVGSAITLSAVGYYLHRRGFVEGEGKRVLAVITQEATFPLFLFTKIIFCNQDWSDDPCPDITKSIKDVWMLLIWPFYVVGMGIAVGYLIAYLAKTPPHQVPALLACLAFSNSTALPITLLAVVHSNFPATSDLGRVDPTLFLSVYLLVYPILQWGYGGWLLAPEDDDDDDDDKSEEKDETPANPEVVVHIAGISTERPSSPASVTDVHHGYQHRQHSHGHKHTRTMLQSLRRNVLNNRDIDEYYVQHRHGLRSADEGLYLSQVDLARLAHEHEQQQQQNHQQHQSQRGQVDPSATQLSTVDDDHSETTDQAGEVQPFLPSERGSHTYGSLRYSVANSSTRMFHQDQIRERFHASLRTMKTVEATTLWETTTNVMRRCFQPPAMGALAGILVAMTPLRGIFVDLKDRSSHAPLQWFFDGLYSVGLTAVPINMMILGCNLSACLNNIKARKNCSPDELDALTTTGGFLPYPTMIGIVVGKMIILPIIGILSTVFLKLFVLDIPDDISGAFYLVVMIVFLTPTANNVMVMIELSGSDTVEGIASVIAIQYAVAPLILSLTMTISIGISSNWS